MGHYSFLRDLEESKVAVNVVKVYIEELYNKKGQTVTITELERERQGEGDIEIKPSKGRKYTVEVKYDMMAKKTGNLCFETHNIKGKLTGISSTKAKEVHYVVPDETGYMLYMFKAKKLKAYLFDTANTSKFRSVKGGDRWSTFMLLVKREVIDKDKVAYKVEHIDA